MLPTYRRRPSEIAWGTWGLGLLNAILEVLVFGPGDPALCALGLSSPFTRQLGEWKARPVVLTPFWKDLTGARDSLVIHGILSSFLDPAPNEQPQGTFFYTLCCCGTGLSGASTILIYVLLDSNINRVCKNRPEQPAKKKLAHWCGTKFTYFRKRQWWAQWSGRISYRWIRTAKWNKSYAIKRKKRISRSPSNPKKEKSRTGESRYRTKITSKCWCLLRKIADLLFFWAPAEGPRYKLRKLCKLLIMVPPSGWSISEEALKTAYKFLLLSSVCFSFFSLCITSFSQLFPLEMHTTRGHFDCWPDYVWSLWIVCLGNNTWSIMMDWCVYSSSCLFCLWRHFRILEGNRFFFPPTAWIV